jgi:hypothetical protein
MEHGDEFIPVGFEESLERLADTMGAYRVRSNIRELDGLAITIGHYDLTMYVQEEWDKFNDVDNPPRRGFFLSSRSASAAAGRAAEEVVLQKLLWRCKFDGPDAPNCIPFWQAVDEGKVVRPRGVASDDIVLELSDGTLACVESKASFNGKAPFGRFRAKAAAQLKATVEANPSVAHAVLAFVDLKGHEVLVLSVGRREMLTEGVTAVERVYRELGGNP